MKSTSSNQANVHHEVALLYAYCHMFRHCWYVRYPSQEYTFKLIVFSSIRTRATVGKGSCWYIVYLGYMLTNPNLPTHQSLDVCYMILVLNGMRSWCNLQLFVPFQSLFWQFMISLNSGTAWITLQWITLHIIVTLTQGELFKSIALARCSHYERYAIAAPVRNVR